MNRRNATVAALIGALVAPGCTTLADAQNAKGNGTVREYTKPYEPVWNATLASVQSSGLALVHQDKVTGRILAQGTLSWFTWGENVAIYVAPSGDKTRVEVVNKAALSTNVTSTEWGRRIFEDLDRRIATQ